MFDMRRREFMTLLGGAPPVSYEEPMRDIRRDAFCVRAPAFAILALVLSFSPVLAGGLPQQLERVVILSRHGVRSPTQDDNTLNNYRKSGIPPWPDFGVQQLADLTLKGALLMQRMGAHYREKWQPRFGDPSRACPNPNPFFYADRDERTLMTARSLVGGLAGGACELPVLEIIEPDVLTERIDPVFHPINKTNPSCKVKNPPHPTVSPDQVSRVQKVVDCCQADFCNKILGKTSCDLQQLMDGTKPGTPPHNDAYNFIQGFGEILLFEYAQGFVGRNFAFGKIAPDPIRPPPADKPEWWKLLAIHADLFNKIERHRDVALLQGANLLYHMISAIATGRPLIPPAVGPPVNFPVKFMVYVGHDTNIANVAKLLGLHWQVGDYPADDVAPGAALAFEVRQTLGAPPYVNALMLVQPPDSLRADGSDIRSRPLPIRGCKSPEGSPDGSCAMSDFVSIAMNIVKKARAENSACITDWKDDLAD
jgi:4-phytase/acid phosphatase